jgi:hypothetical protein
MDRQRLAEVQTVIRADIKAGLYHGAVINVARAGAGALEAAIGAAVRQMLSITHRLHGAAADCTELVRVVETRAA